MPSSTFSLSSKLSTGAQKYFYPPLFNAKKVTRGSPSPPPLPLSFHQTSHPYNYWLISAIHCNMHYGTVFKGSKVSCVSVYFLFCAYFLPTNVTISHCYLYIWAKWTAKYTQLDIFLPVKTETNKLNTLLIQALIPWEVRRTGQVLPQQYLAGVVEKVKRSYYDSSPEIASNGTEIYLAVVPSKEKNHTIMCSPKHSTIFIKFALFNLKNCKLCFKCPPCFFVCFLLAELRKQIFHLMKWNFAFHTWKHSDY